ncbi:MAG: SdpI family protein [Cellulosilyticum sp.]|nr:SdpI family protein [Cellulosilyticum sp.]
MSFWIFMLLMTLLIPISMIGFGYYFSKKAPKEINNVLGYRTSRSMKNKETWQFAHNYFGKLWLKNTFDEKGQRYCPSGLNKKSFSIPFHGGEIWIEHLDSFGNEITLLKQKFIEDIPQISQPSTSSLIAINLDESHIDKEILSWILDTLSTLPAPPQKVVFIGLTPKLKRLVKLKQKQITFLVTCIDDFEKAKEWLL